LCKKNFFISERLVLILKYNDSRTTNTNTNTEEKNRPEPARD